MTGHEYNCRVEALRLALNSSGLEAPAARVVERAEAFLKFLTASNSTPEPSFQDDPVNLQFDEAA